jgi:hypothetical protein
MVFFCVSVNTCETAVMGATVWKLALADAVLGGVATAPLRAATPHRPACLRCWAATDGAACGVGRVRDGAGGSLRAAGV